MRVFAMRAKNGLYTMACGNELSFARCGTENAILFAPFHKYSTHCRQI